MTDPSEELQQRRESDGRLSTEQLQQILDDQAKRLHAAQIEERALISRWTDIHHAISNMTIRQRDIESILLRRMAAMEPE